MKFSNTSLPQRYFTSGLIALGLAFCVTVPPVAAQDGEIARINGVVVTEKDIAMALDDIRESIPDMSEAERLDYLVTYLADIELVAGAARDAGLADEPDFKRRMDYLRKRNLMELYLAREGQAASNETAAHELYDEMIEEIPEEPRIRARHILVESEEEAKEIRAAIEDGGDFAAIAKEKSSDPGSGANGGDLGWFTKEQMVPEFAEAAFALEPGQVSDPVKSDFGWHIIKSEDKRNKPGFDEVEGQLYEMLARQSQRDTILSLRENAEIERLYKAREKDGGADSKDADSTDAAPEGEKAMDGEESKSD